MAGQLVLQAIERRFAAHQKAERNIEYTKDFLCMVLGAKLLKPQRLVSLSVEEEERRCHLSWQFFDNVMRIAAFGSREELAEMVNSPESFIKNRAQLTIVMSDQIPYYVKIQPGKQLYAEWERQSGKKD